MSPVLFREHKAAFGPYLRELRVARGVSLRDAAGRLGISFAKLQKMETGGRFRIESAGMFEGLAELYERPVEEVLAAAGVQLEMPVRAAQLAITVEAGAGDDPSETINARFSEGWRFTAAVTLPAVSVNQQPVKGRVMVILGR